MHTGFLKRNFRAVKNGRIKTGWKVATVARKKNAHSHKKDLVRCGIDGVNRKPSDLPTRSDTTNPHADVPNRVSVTRARATDPIVKGKTNRDAAHRLDRIAKAAMLLEQSETRPVAGDGRKTGSNRALRTDVTLISLDRNGGGPRDCEIEKAGEVRIDHEKGHTT